MDIKERIKLLVDRFASGKYTVFARNSGIPVSTFKNYVDGSSNPTSEHLKKIASVFGVNLNWLILGEGGPFVERKQGEEYSSWAKASACDPVIQLLNDEVERAGITLTSEQRKAVLKILRELVYRDVRSIQELLSSFSDRGKQGDES
jgi:transcriptional regulator with XRE-family HTH domain